MEEDTVKSLLSFKKINLLNFHIKDKARVRDREGEWSNERRNIIYVIISHPYLQL